MCTIYLLCRDKKEMKKIRLSVKDQDYLQESPSVDPQDQGKNVWCPPRSVDTLKHGE